MNSTRFVSAMTLIASLVPLSHAAAQSYQVVDLGSRQSYGTPNQTIAAGLDSFGRVTGRATGEFADLPFVWDVGSFRLFNSFDRTLDAGGTAINDHGIVVGWNETGQASSRHAVAWFGGLIIDLGTLGGLNSEAKAINRNDWIVGWSDNDEQSPHGFVYHNNHMYDIGTLPGGFESEAAAINSFGRVAGWSRDSNGRHNAIIWENDLLLSIGILPGDRDSFATGINDHDQVVGTSDEHAFLFEGDFSGGTMTQLPSLGGARSGARDINNAGVIVGTSELAQGGARACIWIDRQPYDLNQFIAPQSGWYIDYPNEINDAGYISAQATRDFTSRSVLLIPTPLHMSPPTPGLAGQVNTFVVTGATPGAPVRLLYGTEAGYSHPAGCPTAIVEMAQSAVAATATANQDGIATFELFVPSAARGRIFIVQMLEPTDCAISQPLPAVFR